MGLENILYSREGLGQYGVPIKVYKIRTMTPNAESDFEALAEENGIDGLGKIVDDPRVTSIGKVLRRFGLDELPQVYNILRGEMALVGIRPRSEGDWTHLPDKLKKHALRYRPGWFTPAYSKVEVRDTEELVEVETNYLQQKDVSPIRTNIKYLSLIIFNFIFRGVRSK